MIIFKMREIYTFKEIHKNKTENRNASFFCPQAQQTANVKAVK